jgi:hypothetical protein
LTLKRQAGFGRQVVAIEGEEDALIDGDAEIFGRAGSRA